MILAVSCVPVVFGANRSWVATHYIQLMMIVLLPESDVVIIFPTTYAEMLSKYLHLRILTSGMQLFVDIRALNST